MSIIKNLWENYLLHIIDILLVAFIIYNIIILIKGKRTVQILLGLTILALLTLLVKNVLHLPTLTWLLEKFWLAGVIIIAIIFQPELRAIFAELGSKSLSPPKPIEVKNIETIISTIAEFSRKKIGALLVFEKNIGLKDYADTGVPLEAKITKELLLSIFNPESPLHDGAVVIKNDKIVSAGVILPISNSKNIPFGLRHKAAVGITELSDAIAIVVSEKEGNISFASNGSLQKIKNLHSLKEKLYDSYRK